MTAYRPPSFDLRELIAPTIYDRLGNASWEFLHEDALRSLQALRDKFGVIVVNNWHTGGAYRESGLRETDSRTGAPKSAHKRGMAFDCKPAHTTVREMYDYVLDNQHEFPLIRRIENIKATPTWLHVDVVPHNGTGIRVFMP